MIRTVLLALAALLAAPAAAQTLPPLSFEQQALARCSAAFALVAAEQARGEPSAQAYPPLATRGREFFARANARLIDELGLSREQVDALMRREAQQLQAGAAQSGDRAAFFRAVMDPCLLLLDASGL